MHHFVNFCNDKRLFKCEPHEFKMMIQNVFNEILTASFIYDDYINITLLKFNNPNRRCMICSNFINIQYFIICKRCVKQCVGLNVDLYFGKLNNNCALICDKKKLFDEFGLKYLISNNCINDYGNCLKCLRSNILSGYTICDLCGMSLAKINIGLSIASFINNDNVIYTALDKDDLLSSQFITHLPELFDRFFNTTIIIFIMALTDSTSSIYALNNDILMYILSFIY